MLRSLGDTTTPTPDVEPFGRGVTAAVKDLAERYPLPTLAAALIIGALLAGPLFYRR